METNKIRIIEKKFYSLFVADILKAIDGRSYLGAIILTCNLIEICSNLKYDDMTSNQKFQKWVNEYLGCLNIKYKEEYVQLLLRKARNGLVHGGFSKKNTKPDRIKGTYKMYFTVSPQDSHLELKKNTDLIIINLYYLLPHVIMGVWQMFREFELTSDSEVNKFIVIDSFNPDLIEIPFGRFHHVLSIFDKENPSVIAIQTKLDELLSS